jgi:hypothetical protein
VLIADWIFGRDKLKPQRSGAASGDPDVDRPDVFGRDYNSIFDSESAWDDYYRKVRQERYEFGRARDGFEPVE